MTLFKQIAIILSIFLVIILSTVLVLNFSSASQSVQKRLFEDAKSTASSLSLSLGSANGDIAMMSTMINANFDSGNYQFISLVDVDGESLHVRDKSTYNANVPQWFISILNITAPIASENVSAGWSPIGLLNVQSNVDYAHTQLYTILKSLLISFSLLAFFGLSILNLLIHMILKPLKKVQVQAEAIAKNKFIIQEQLPYTEEFKDVVLGMNTMVRKVKAMFDKGNEELQRQKELEYTDQSTKLRNRKYLIDKLPQYLKIDAQSNGGINIMIAISGIAQANEHLGHININKLFSSMAKIFSAYANNHKNSIVARMNGTEFSILLPDCTHETGMHIAEGIHEAITKLISDFDLSSEATFVSLGLYKYNYTQSIPQLLSFSDNALAQAKFSNTNIHLEHAQSATEVMGKDAWRMIINKAITRNSFEFISYKAVNSKTKKDIHNALSITLSVDNDTYTFGQFMAPANQAGLGSSIYTKVLDMMFTQPDAKLKNSTCSLRLPFDFINSAETYNNMRKLFKKHASKLPFKLIIEMPDKLMHKNSEATHLYKKLFDEHNIGLGIFEFIGESSDYQYLQDLRPLYIKGERDYFLGQSVQGVSALKLITDSIGIDLIATGVIDIDCVNGLNEKEVTIVQGSVTKLL